MKIGSGKRKRRCTGWARPPHRSLLTLFLVLVFAPVAQPAPRDALLERAKSLELDTPYVPPPGNALEHHASGYAKIMCSAVFIAGLDPAFAAENVGFFTAPYAERARMGKPVVDRAAKAVHVMLPNGIRRTAVQVGDQGCVTLPQGRSTVYFSPLQVRSRLPDPATQPWPMGDRPDSKPLPPEIDAAKLKRAVDAAFESADGLTAAFVVTWRGRLVGERYGKGVTPHTPLESWSMGKSVAATLLGMLIRQGVYELWQPAPIPEWQTAGDPRSRIRIADLLRMSSGLRIRAPQDPDYDPSGPYPDHVYLYTGSVDSFRYAATRPLQWPPGTVGRYRNTDPVLVSYLVRLGVEQRGEEYLSFPQRMLFDKLGIRTMVLETDPYGNFLLQGYELASARDWARLGNLYLQDGVWNGERILPEGYVRFVSTVAPAWKDGGQPYYGGFFWLNTAGAWPVPRDAYYMAGSGTQVTLIVPSHDLVVARLGHYRGAAAGAEGLRNALALLMEAVPRSK
ncbi:MAG TPA: serine hydrolase [Burkholderiales bacterium]|nr:serine hydrolase [Burkholderiales bacterium]